MPVSFGEFAFDAGARVLLRQGRPVHLSPRGFKLLEILVRNQPRPVPKTVLTSELWPDTFVSDGNLPNVVLELRQALHDESAELVRTVYGLGYAFAGDAVNAELPPATEKLGIFRLKLEGREVGLVEGENWIGRGLDCLVQVHCSLASRRHARIVVSGEKATIEDGPSTHGTVVNWERVKSPTPLRNGDLIRIGSVHMTLVMVRPDAPTDRTPGDHGIVTGNRTSDPAPRETMRAARPHRSEHSK